MTGALDQDERDALLDIARSAIAERLGLPTSPATDLEAHPRLSAPGACFVSLHRDGRLLGCIGSMEPRRALAADVAANALAAAFADPRLPAVTAEDCRSMTVEISVLGPLDPLPAQSAQELGSTVVPGTDGVLISGPGHRGTFLPSVWASLPRREDFLRQLWRKAGLRPFDWPAGLVAFRYRTEQFGGRFATEDSAASPPPIRP